jgi:hypothetical protein
LKHPTKNPIVFIWKMWMHYEKCMFSFHPSKTLKCHLYYSFWSNGLGFFFPKIISFPHDDYSVCVQRAWCFVKSHHLHYPLKLLASTSFVANHWNVEPTRSNHVHSSFKNRTNLSTFMVMHAWKPLGQWPHVFEKNTWL